MKTIRASEISSYLYCQRAWWFQLQGVKSTNQADLMDGSAHHQRHGRMVKGAGCLKSVAYGLLVLAMVALLIWFAGWIA